MARTAGVLLSISMLPNEYGIGGFGDEALEFGKRVRSIGFRDWQILPLTTIGMGNSPYSGVSAFAGNYLYIDPKRLQKSGLIDDDQARESVYNGSIYTVNYDFVRYSKKRIIQHCAGKVDTSEYYEREKDWLKPYAEYMVIKELNELRPWYEWSDELKSRDMSAVDKVIAENKEKFDYYVLEQYLFDKQWSELKTELNAIDMKIIGDMPIYVSHDSADVWANRDIFKLDADGNPTEIAGVPPDYFSADGQLWGNPLYDYNAMAKDGYKWFKARVRRMNTLYDALRIDHFRAFDRYWSVPNGSKTAVNGKWEQAKGKELLTAVMKDSPGIELIAEDLGIIDDGVIKLRESLGLAGMHVMQFGLNDPTSTNCPHNFIKNSVAYTGTHDNTTAFAWLYEMQAQERENVLKYIGSSGAVEGGSYSKQIFALIRCLMTSVADRAIVPFQDLCGWGGDTRFNIPGVANGNWVVRITDNAINSLNVIGLNDLIRITGRM